MQERRKAQRRKGPIRAAKDRRAGKAAPKGVERRAADRRTKDRRSGKDRRKGG